MDNNEIQTLDELVEAQHQTETTQTCPVVTQDSFGTELAKAAATGVVTVLVTSVTAVAVTSVMAWADKKMQARAERKALKDRLEQEEIRQALGLNDEETAS